VAAPEAVSVPGNPVHIVIGAAVIVGSGLTVTTAVVVFTQPAAEVPVMVYVVVADGFAVTEDPVVALKPVAGDHEYVEAPEALRVPGVPAHIAMAGTVITGSGLTVIVATAVPVHPPAVPVTV
jgi:hypothetical protein